MAQHEQSAPADVPEMVSVVGVRFRRAGKIYYFDPAGVPCRAGDRVVVETEAGNEVGEVAIETKQVPAHTVVMPLRSVLRPVNEQDQGVLQRRREGERSALDIALERAAAHGLDMKFVSAETAFDGNRVRLFFVSEDRVDFRQLVRDLAGRLRTRIELRQIGVRDQAKMVGGIGDCGRELCCATWMDDFEPVSIRMAKTQNLSLNPSRLSGQCGRLKCCLKFEHDMYQELLKGLPKIGTWVLTAKGRGKVIELLALKESVLVDLGDGRRIVVKASDLRVEGEPGPKGAADAEDMGLDIPEDDDVPEDDEGLVEEEDAYALVAASSAAASTAAPSRAASARAENAAPASGAAGAAALAASAAAAEAGASARADGAVGPAAGEDAAAARPASKRAEGRSGAKRRRRRRPRKGPKPDGGQG